MGGMSLTRRAIDKLPAWAQTLLLILAIPFAIYEAHHYGFWRFLFRVIFSPEI